MFRGYYHMPDKTREAVDDSGWLHTGDIALWTLDGKLVIVDRKKNLFKLAQGEYVAPERIETVLSRAPLVHQCFVWGDPLHSHLVAVVVPDPVVLRDWGRQHGVPTGDVNEICGDARAAEAVLHDLRRAATAGGLRGFEVPQAVLLEPLPFSAENGALTPTNKLRRRDVAERYRTRLLALYESTAVQAVAGGAAPRVVAAARL